MVQAEGSDAVGPPRRVLARLSAWFNAVAADSFRALGALPAAPLAALLERIARLHAARRDLAEALGAMPADLDDVGAAAVGPLSAPVRPVSPWLSGEDSGAAEAIPDRGRVMRELVERFSTPRDGWVRALAGAGTLDPGLIAALAARADSLSPAQLDGVLGALRDLRGVAPAPLAARLLSRVRETLPAMRAEQCVSVASALDALGMLDRDMLRALLFRAATAKGDRNAPHASHSAYPANAQRPYARYKRHPRSVPISTASDPSPTLPSLPHASQAGTSAATQMRPAPSRERPSANLSRATRSAAPRPGCHFRRQRRRSSARSC